MKSLGETATSGRRRQFGDTVAHALELVDTPSVITETLHGSQIAINLQEVGSHRIGRSATIPAEDTFITSVCLTAIPLHEIYSRGRLVHRGGYGVDSLHIVNLADEYSLDVHHPHEVLAFYIPRATLDGYADESSLRRISTLACRPGTVDPALQHLTRALLPAFRRPAEINRLFVDHVALAVCAHLVSAYGSTSSSPSSKQRVDRFRIERAKELLAAHLNGHIGLEAVAGEVGVSRGHLVRAFKTTTGSTPHQWLQRRRVDLAKALIMARSSPLAEVASTCGFFDQSHLTRVFQQVVGQSPAAWRRSHS